MNQFVFLVMTISHDLDKLVVKIMDMIMT